jgi:hypothetical protein
MTGEWSRKSWYGGELLPGWWFSDDHRSWVLSVLGWDGDRRGSSPDSAAHAV